LSENGNLDVPPEKTDAFCEGPCMSETNLVLGCIDNIFSNFIFYNRATIGDVKETILAGCGYGPERGNYHVLIEYYNLLIYKLYRLMYNIIYLQMAWDILDQFIYLVLLIFATY
jgi:hypothetical protein